MVGLLARGLQTKQVARALGISAKTADRHVQNAYAKIGVSTRAGGGAVRDGARAGGLGRTPDGQAAAPGPSVPLHVNATQEEDHDGRPHRARR